jgi:hypothetical protein
MSYSNTFDLAMLNVTTDMVAPKRVRPLAHSVKNELEAYIVTAIQHEMRSFVPILLRDIREQMKEDGDAEVMRLCGRWKRRQNQRTRIIFEERKTETDIIEALPT